jgi:hypothetical protein
MCAVSEQRYGGDEHGENRHGHGDGRKIVLGSFFSLFFQLSKIFGHSVSLIRKTKLVLNL